jgi:hypothetical protein
MEGGVMSKRKILIFDDEESNREKYVKELNKTVDLSKKFQIESIQKEDFLREWNILVSRYRNLRETKKKKDETSVLDDTSVFIIDYDLIKASDSSGYLTGENVSYLVRNFSKCLFIIGFTQFGTNYFDLTLKKQSTSHADLRLGSDQLTNPGLWSKERTEFLPWCWPNIPKYLDNLPKKLEDIENNMDESICDYFGMTKDVIGNLPRSVSEFIGKNPQETTFKQFLRESDNALSRVDRKFVDKLDSDVKKLLISSRISKWLEQMVLPGQNTLIDAPHLVQKYPSLLKGEITDPKSWNATATFEKVGSIGLEYKIIEDYRFKKEHWLSHPAWFLNQVNNCQKIKEVLDPWTKTSTDFVFCEDSSSFYKKTDCKEFLAELDSPYIRRYVRKFKGIEYTPHVRFSL